jgi:hypothetical protein
MPIPVGILRHVPPHEPVYTMNYSFYQDRDNDPYDLENMFKFSVTNVRDDHYVDMIINAHYDREPIIVNSRIQEPGFEPEPRFDQIQDPMYEKKYNVRDIDQAFAEMVSILVKNGFPRPSVQNTRLEVSMYKMLDNQYHEMTENENFGVHFDFDDYKEDIVKKIEKHPITKLFFIDELHAATTRKNRTHFSKQVMKELMEEGQQHSIIPPGERGSLPFTHIGEEFYKAQKRFMKRAASHTRKGGKRRKKPTRRRNKTNRRNRRL